MEKDLSSDDSRKITGMNRENYPNEICVWFHIKILIAYLRVYGNTLYLNEYPIMLILNLEKLY